MSNVKRILQIMRDFGNLESSDLSVIEQEQEKYPYAQIFKVLEARLKNEEKMEGAREASDMARLYSLDKNYANRIISFSDDLRSMDAVNEDRNVIYENVLGLVEPIDLHHFEKEEARLEAERLKREAEERARQEEEARIEAERKRIEQEEKEARLREEARIEAERSSREEAAEKARLQEVARLEEETRRLEQEQKTAHLKEEARLEEEQRKSKQESEKLRLREVAKREAEERMKELEEKKARIREAVRQEEQNKEEAEQPVFSFSANIDTPKVEKVEEVITPAETPVFSFFDKLEQTAQSIKVEEKEEVVFNSNSEPETIESSIDQNKFSFENMLNQLGNIEPKLPIIPEEKREGLSKYKNLELLGLSDIFSTDKPTTVEEIEDINTRDIEVEQKIITQESIEEEIEERPVFSFFERVEPQDIDEEEVRLELERNKEIVVESETEKRSSVFSFFERIEEINNTVETSESVETELEQETISKERKLEEEELVSASEKRTFTDWLNLSNNRLLERKVVKTIREQDEIIDKFIEENPKIKPISKKEIEPNAPIDIKKNDVKNIAGVMTETLADLYVEQGKYDTAIKALKILSLKNPEKSSYFADKIKDINNKKKQ